MKNSTKTRTFTMTVRMDNAAFSDDPGELSRIIRLVASKLQDASAGPEDDIDDWTLRLRDINGNTVGEASIETA